MNQPPIFGWRARLAVDAGLVAIFLVVMIRHDAPPWAIALLGFVATRASATSLAAGLSYLQQTIRRRADERPNMELQPGELERALGQPAAPTDPNAPPPRRGVGRWGRGEKP